MSPIFEGSEDVTGAKQPERVEAVNGSFSYFSMLGATPQIGRLFGPQDFVRGFAAVAVISDGLWRRAYGADPNVIGRTLRIDNDPLTNLLGFCHADFAILDQRFPATWKCLAPADSAQIPFPANTWYPDSSRWNRTTQAWPDTGASSGRLTIMAAQLRHDFPTDYPPQAQSTIEIQPLQETLVGKVRPMLLVLLVAVILIVFIVSLNITNLLLARASGRQQEMAMRSALGASRGRIMRQMLTESMLLSLVGGAAGIATAVSTLSFILRFVPSNVPRLSEVRIDWVVLAFALLISILTGLVFGLTPALHSAKGALSSAIREGGRGSGYSTKTGRLRDVLIVSELAFRPHTDGRSRLAAAYVAASVAENPGFNPTQVVTANIQLPNPNDRKRIPITIFLAEPPLIVSCCGA